MSLVDLVRVQIHEDLLIELFPEQDHLRDEPDYVVLLLRKEVGVIVLDQVHLVLDHNC
jgi:hypothetical protein